MKKNVLLFSHQMKVGGAPTVLCEMGIIPVGRSDADAV